MVRDCICALRHKEECLGETAVDQRVAGPAPVARTFSARLEHGSLMFKSVNIDLPYASRVKQTCTATKQLCLRLHPFVTARGETLCPSIASAENSK